MEPVKKFIKFAISVDGVIFGFDETDLKVLLIERGEEPYVGEWALPGDLVYPNEDTDTAAQRVLEELTGLKDVFLEHLGAFGKVGRHPLGRVITLAYYALIKVNKHTVTPDSFAQNAKWHKVSDLEGLPFDHYTILQKSLDRLKQNVRIRPIGFELLPPKFTLTELQNLYQAILETDLDKRNFRKKILSMNLLVDLDELQEGVAHRPAKLYQFDEQRYQELVDEGFSFELKETKRKVRAVSV